MLKVMEEVWVKLGGGMAGLPHREVRSKTLPSTQPRLPPVLPPSSFAQPR